MRMTHLGEKDFELFIGGGECLSTKLPQAMNGNDLQRK